MTDPLDPHEIAARWLAMGRELVERVYRCAGATEAEIEDVLSTLDAIERRHKT